MDLSWSSHDSFSFLGKIDKLGPLGLSLFHLMIGLVFYFSLLVVDFALLPWSSLGVPWLFIAEFLDNFNEVYWSFFDGKTCIILAISSNLVCEDLHESAHRVSGTFRLRHKL